MNKKWLYRSMPIDKLYKKYANHSVRNLDSEHQLLPAIDNIGDNTFYKSQRFFWSVTQRGSEAYCQWIPTFVWWPSVFPQYHGQRYPWAWAWTFSWMFNIIIQTIIFLLRSVKEYNGCKNSNLSRINLSRSPLEQYSTTSRRGSVSVTQASRFTKYLN